MPLAHGISDTALVNDLIESEFGFRPLIARTRRLGRPIDGRIQPIAVTLSVINDAIYLVDNAKMLRKSANDNVRQLIYINRDMTKAEAQAAFDQRNRRRNQRRTGVNHPPAAQSTVRPASSQPMGTTDNGHQLKLSITLHLQIPLYCDLPLSPQPRFMNI